MMRYLIDRESPVPAYLQLYRQLREDIVRGVYPYGGKLPSKRLVAGELQLSTVTVEHAYALLDDEGYVKSRQRSGYYVSFRTDEGFTAPPEAEPGRGGMPRQKTPLAGSDLPERGSLPRRNVLQSGCDLQGQAGLQRRNTQPAGNVLHEESSRESQDGYDPEGAAGRTEFPFSVLAKTMRKVISDRGKAILNRSPNMGVTELRGAISRYLGRSRGIAADAGQIVIGSGSEYLYGLIVELLGRDRIYGIEAPSYKKIEQVYRACDVRVEKLPLGSDGIKSAALRDSRADILHISPYRSFPSGVTASASKRHEYIRWAAKPGRYLVEDDFESEFSVLTKPEETLFSLASEDNVIYMNTFSQTVSPSLRAGYMVLPRPLAAEFAERLGFYACTVPTYLQYVLAELIDSGEFERHINRVRRKKRDAIKKG